MPRFTKAHAYGNDFLYVPQEEVRGVDVTALARRMCDRHAGIGADGLIVYRWSADAASMHLFNVDGSRAEVSGNGVRALAALLLRDDPRERPELVVRTEGGDKQILRTGRDGARQMFRAAMGLPRDLRRVSVDAAGERVDLVVMDFGNPQAVRLGPQPDPSRFERLGAALERHPMFPERTNVEFATVEASDRVRILIWERGVGPTRSSGTGSCAALIAAAAFGGGSRSAEVIAPGGAQQVEWADDSVYLTGWAEVICDGEWLQPIPASLG